MSTAKPRRLVLVLGDQLNPDSAAFDDFDAGRDAVPMLEARHEASYVPQHKHRLVLFFSAMRPGQPACKSREAEPLPEAVGEAGVVRIEPEVDVAG